MSLPLPDGRSTRVAGVFAHPDDETFFAGATFATYAALGCEVRLATLTGGEVFGPVQVERYDRACAALGASGTQLRPGLWQDLGRSGASNSLAAAPLEEVVAAVAEFVAAFEPHVLITNDASGVTGHPDHVRAHEAVLAAAGGRVPIVLAGCLRATDVSAAVERLGALAPGQPIGSGGVSGVDEADVLELDPATQARESRAAALDGYYPGLGSRPLEDLVDPAGRVGDGVVLRAVADAARHREYFRAF
ncbi:PIG-L deacetylase family protein [Flindersiella endophytica]